MVATIRPQLWATPAFRERYKLYWKQGPTLWPSQKPLGVFGFYVRDDVYGRLTR